MPNCRKVNILRVKTITFSLEKHGEASYCCAFVVNDFPIVITNDRAKAFMLAVTLKNTKSKRRQ